jgi:hypothetical protein
MRAAHVKEIVRPPRAASQISTARSLLLNATRSLLALFAIASLPARADDPPAPAPATAPVPARAEAVKPAGKLKVLRLDELTVEGRIQKPQAFFILQRSNLNFDDGDKKESFLPKIVKSCDKDPF